MDNNLINTIKELAAKAEESIPGLVKGAKDISTGLFNEVKKISQAVIAKPAELLKDGKSETAALDAAKKRLKAGSALDRSSKPISKTHLKGGLLTGVGLLFAIAALSISTAFDSPEDIINSEVLSPTPVVQSISMEEALETAPEAERHKERKKSLRTVIREKVSEWPKALRVGIAVPMYAIGMLITKALGAFFTTVMAPVLASVIKWIVFALVLLLVIGIVVKALFPNVPFSKVFTLRNFLFLLAAVAVLALADKAMPLIFADYSKWMDAFKFTCGLIIIILTVVPASTHFIKKTRDRKIAETA